MGLRTVRVPSAMEAIFERAEDLVARYFGHYRVDPEQGVIQVGEQRYVLLRAASLSVAFFDLVRDLYGEGREQAADAFARNILFDLAHSVGKADAREFQRGSSVTNEGPGRELAAMACGPIHFAYSGWGSVEILPESSLAADESFLLVYETKYSFEADAWIKAGRGGEQPVCIMNAGYSSGWCEESFAIALVSAEVVCRACGGEICRFVMSHPSRASEQLQKRRMGTFASAPGARDIPELFARKRFEEALRQARDELEHRVQLRTAELREANTRLRHEMEERKLAERKLLQAQKLEAIGTLAGGVAHDFNNLIAVILGNAGLLAKRIPEDETSRLLLAHITDAGKQAAGLTRQLLAFSRGQVLASELLDVNPIIRDLARMLARVIGEEISLVLDLKDGIGVIQADRGQLEQVIMNLVVNARDAMPNGGTLTIETSEQHVAVPRRTEVGTLAPGAYVRICVTDTGVGMDEKTLAHAFDPFFTTKAEGKGTGLGLATVYGILHQQGGGITVRTDPAEGATFCVFYPLASENRHVSSGWGPEASPLRGIETILVVEDQDPLREVLAQSLRELGYTVLTASGPDEARRLVDAYDGPIHLLLTDVVMPRMRGPQLAEALRKTRRELRVLFMSGYTDDVALAAGAPQVALLSKPFLPDVLARKVREVLDTMPVAPGDKSV